MLNISTHGNISKELCGTPIENGGGNAVVELLLTEEMTVDDSGLVHGGFIFGLADHAAMLAVNHPFVVLGSSEAKFMKPSVKGEKAIASARTESVSGKKHVVKVTVEVNGTTVFESTMTCFVPDRHVLSK